MMNHFEMMTPSSDQIVNGALDTEKSYWSLVAERC